MVYHYLFSIDVESVGLMGTPFAIGVSVRDIENQKEIDTFSARCPIESCDDYDVEHPSLEWLQKNVLPHLHTDQSMTVVKNPYELRELFWTFYKLWRKKDDVMFMTDCGVPVESYLFRLCVMDNVKERLWESPYPLFDLSNLLYFVGKDPVGTYERNPDELPAHHPLTDARQSARLWLQNKIDNF